jgi:hypothetical protein
MFVPGRAQLLEERPAMQIRRNSLFLIEHRLFSAGLA